MTYAVYCKVDHWQKSIINMTTNQETYIWSNLIPVMSVASFQFSLLWTIKNQKRNYIEIKNITYCTTSWIHTLCKVISFNTWCSWHEISPNQKQGIHVLQNILVYLMNWNVIFSSHIVSAVLTSFPCAAGQSILLFDRYISCCFPFM